MGRTPQRGTSAGSAGRPRLLNPAMGLYISAMIAVKAENGCLQVTIPTEGMTPGEVNDFVSWLRVESVVRRSRLTPEAAWKLSEDIKSDWWQANERRVTPEGAEGSRPGSSLTQKFSSPCCCAERPPCASDF